MSNTFQESRYLLYLANSGSKKNEHIVSDTTEILDGSIGKKQQTDRQLPMASPIYLF